MTDKDQLQGHDPAREEQVPAKAEDKPKPKAPEPKETPKSKE